MSLPNAEPLAAPSLMRYAALALPLAFAALPLYVLLPGYYARHYGVPLAVLGTLLFVARALDAVIDPLIGRYADRLLARGVAAVLPVAGGAALLLALGFAALWWAPQLALVPLMAWLFAALAITYLAYSLLTVLHQGWGTQLSAHTVQQSRISAWREGCGLVGVLVASTLPSWAGERALPWALLLLLAVAVGLLVTAPRPAQRAAHGAPHWREVLGNRAFMRLCAVFVINGVAAAVPATLLVFFVQDRLQVADAGPFLLAYFAAAAVSLPVWVRLVRAWGLERAWLAGMVLAIATFVWAVTLGAGDALPFLGVCIASGLAAGADLALPSALVARSIHDAGHAHRLEGSYFGVWAFLTKANLALAAGLALPLLQALGYRPGAHDAAALQALAIGYCAVPCLLKLVAAALLWRLFISQPVAALRHEGSST
ncbi:MAG: MFS transporter [Betaproteobacteria bacterium]|nr:MFS transporter [Betaproteobacteria bacterium]